MILNEKFAPIILKKNHIMASTFSIEIVFKGLPKFSTPVFHPRFSTPIFLPRFLESMTALEFMQSSVNPQVPIEIVTGGLPELCPKDLVPHPLENSPTNPNY